MIVHLHSDIPMAMSIYEQEAEFAMILALVKQLLHLED